MNGKAFTILDPRSFVGIFSDYGCQNTEKSASLTGSGIQTFLEGEENQNTKKNPESYVFCGFIMAYLEAESENRQLKVFPQNDFGYVPERFLLSEKSNSITEHFVYWK